MTNDSSSETETIKNMKDLTQLFILSMTICNECMIEQNGEKINYTSPSPDEIALCKAAKQFGTILKARKGKTVVVEIEGEEQEFQVIMNFEFDSDRKSQSIIIKKDDKYYLMIKGADSSIFNILDENRPQPFLSECKESLYKCSIQGLRTLCFGIR